MIHEQENEENKKIDPPKKVGSYIIGKTIGEGTFNKVKIARHVHSNEQVAIKLIDKSKIKT